MKRIIIRFAARLYPAAWRERYAAELDALLEDLSLNWRDLGDVLGGALVVSVKTWGFWQMSVVCGLGGAIIAAGIAFRIEDKYVSSAVVRVVSADESTAVGGSLDHPLGKPLEDVVQKMRQEGIQVAMLDSRAGEPKRVQVQYVSSNSALARKTVTDCVVKLLEANQEVAANRRSSKGLILEQLDGASQPSPVSPNRLTITEIGVGAGLLLTAASAISRRLFRRPASVRTN